MGLTGAIRRLLCVGAPQAEGAVAASCSIGERQKARDGKALSGSQAGIKATRALPEKIAASNDALQSDDERIGDSPFDIKCRVAALRPPGDKGSIAVGRVATRHLPLSSTSTSSYSSSTADGEKRTSGQIHRKAGTIEKKVEKSEVRKGYHTRSEPDALQVEQAANSSTTMISNGSSSSNSMSRCRRGFGNDIQVLREQYDILRKSFKEMNDKMISSNSANTCAGKDQEPTRRTLTRKESIQSSCMNEVVDGQIWKEAAEEDPLRGIEMPDKEQGNSSSSGMPERPAGKEIKAQTATRMPYPTTRVASFDATQYVYRDSRPESNMLRERAHIRPRAPLRMAFHSQHHVIPRSSAAESVLRSARQLDSRVIIAGGSTRRWSQ